MQLGSSGAAPAGTNPNAPLGRVLFDDQLHALITISRRVRAEQREREAFLDALANPSGSVVSRFTSKAKKKPSRLGSAFGGLLGGGGGGASKA